MMTAAVGGLSASQTVAAADSQLESDTWYDATVTDVTDALNDFISNGGAVVSVGSANSSSSA
jgi:divalent metal cation (Fe/Co/Zn/Cd) transporter